MSTGCARLPGTDLNRSSLGQPDAQARAFTARVRDDCLGQIFDCFPDEMKRQPRWGRTRCKVTCFEFGTGRRRSSPGHRNSPYIRTGDLPINAPSFTCQDVHDELVALIILGAAPGWACIGRLLKRLKYSTYLTRAGRRALRGSLDSSNDSNTSQRWALRRSGGAKRGWACSGLALDYSNDSKTRRVGLD